MPFPLGVLTIPNVVLNNKNNPQMTIPRPLKSINGIKIILLKRVSNVIRIAEINSFLVITAPTIFFQLLFNGTWSKRNVH